jgi:CAAX protease family protein
MTFVQAPTTGNRSRLRRVFYGPRELRAGWRFAMYVALFEVGILLGDVLVDAAFGTLDQVAGAVVRKVINIVVLVAAGRVMGRLEGRTMTDYGLPWRRMFGAQFWHGAWTAFVAVSVLLGIMGMLGDFHVHGLALRGVEIVEWAGLYLVAFVLVGLDEELRFRGYALFTLSGGIGFWPSAALLSALFGLGHLGNSGETWIGAINVLLGGLVFAHLLRRTGTLWLPIGAHAGWDWAQSYFYGVADSGHQLPGHLLDSSSTGSAWLTGGTVGPEGSLLCTLVLIAAVPIISAVLPEIRYRGPS